MIIDLKKGRDGVYRVPGKATQYFSNLKDGSKALAYKAGTTALKGGKLAVKAGRKAKAAYQSETGQRIRRNIKENSRKAAIATGKGARIAYKKYKEAERQEQLRKRKKPAIRKSPKKNKLYDEDDDPYGLGKGGYF